MGEEGMWVAMSWEMCSCSGVSLGEDMVGLRGASMASNQLTVSRE